MIGSSHRLSAYDRALYRSVAELPTPVLDEPLRRVSDFANFSKPWFLAAGALALFGRLAGWLALRGRPPKPAEDKEHTS